MLGGYLAIHGAQKLFGAFDGPGLRRASKGFERIGLRPGMIMAASAGVSELGGGLLTAAGVMSPLGPLALTGTMAVASTTHRANGPLSQKGGYELPLTNLAAALVLLSTGPGRYSMDHIVDLRPSRWALRGYLLFGVAAAFTTIRMILGAAPPSEPPAAASAATKETSQSSA